MDLGESSSNLVCTLKGDFVVSDYGWCFVFRKVAVYVFWCYGFSPFFLLSTFPFYDDPFFPQEGVPVTSLVQGSSWLADHFRYSQDTYFPLFQGRSFFRPYFCFFSCSYHIFSMILAYFSRLLLSAISSLFLGKVRTLMEFLRNTVALNGLFTRKGLH